MLALLLKLLGKTRRLYRVETLKKAKLPPWLEEEMNPVFGRWFTDNPKVLDWYSERSDYPAKYFLDLSTKEANRYKARNLADALTFSRDPDVEYFLPKELARRKKRY